MDKALVIRELKEGKWRRDLLGTVRVDAADRFAAMSELELQSVFDTVMDVPVNFSPDFGGSIFDLYYTTAWLYTFNALSLPKDMTVLEIAAGDTINVPVALNIYSNGQGKYITANLNKELSERFYKKTEKLSISRTIVEDNAVNLARYVNSQSIDIVTFQHAINDIVQTIVAENVGIDTINSNWKDILAPMIQKVMEYDQRGMLRDIVYDEFVAIIKTCAGRLKNNGYMVFNNCIFKGDLDRGYSRDFYASYIRLALDWLNEADLGLQVVTCAGFDPNWWLVLRKNNREKTG